MASQQSPARKTTTEKQRAPQLQRQPAPQGPAPLAPSAGALQQTVADPRAARPDQILTLQRRYGNHAVQRLLAQASIQASLTVGPAGDHYEQEADRVATQVMRMPAPSPRPALQREADEEAPSIQAQPLSITPLVRRAPEEEGELQAKRDLGALGFDAGQAVEDQLRAQAGGGSPLPADVRAYMEPRFGADFSGVRIHADGQAADLNRQLNAQAFTHGQDIYVGAGKYAPGADDGKRLLAHELTHTIQQTGGTRSGLRAKAGLSLSPAQIQRLAVRADFEKLAGGVGFFEGLGRGLYKNILDTLDLYHKAKNAETLARLELLVRDYIEHYRKQKKHSDADKRRYLFIPGLYKEIREEQHTLKPGGESIVTPTAYKERGAKQRTQGEEGLKEVNKDRESFTKEDPNVQYVFRVIAAIDIPEYLQFAKKRTDLTVQNRLKFWQKRKSNEQIKQEAARSVVESKPEFAGKSEEEKKKAIDLLVENSYAVGHTWVKFLIRTDGKQTSEKSFGFWPLAYFASPTGAVPGQVKHPDTSDNDHAHVLQKDYPVPHKQYLDGLARAYTVLKNPPHYKLIDYNCTKFALDVATAAGVSFPANAFMRVPVAATLGLTKTEAYNPNALYASLEQDPTAADPKKQREQEKQAREQQLSRLENITLTPYTEPDGDRGIPLVASRCTASQFSLADPEYQTHGPDWIEIVVVGSSGAEQFVVKKAEYEAFMKALKERT